MRRLILLLIVVFLLLLPVSVVLADTSDSVVVTAVGFIVESPSDFTLTYINDHTVGISWTMADNATATMVRAAYGRLPESRADGYLVYSGNLTSCNDTAVSLDETATPIYYRGWSQRSDGIWEEQGVSDSIQGVGMTLIAFAMVIMGLMVLGFIFRQALLFVIAGFASIGLGIILFGQETLSESWMFGWVSVVLGLACFVLSVLVYYWVKTKEWEKEQKDLEQHPIYSEEEAYSRMLNRVTAEPKRIMARDSYNKLLKRPSSEFQSQEGRRGKD